MEFFNDDNWDNGLCREFSKASKYLFDYYKNGNEYDFESIGAEVLKIFREIFEDQKS